jgi:hypothetical protein
MLIPSKTKMREINERSDGLTEALAYWTTEAARINFTRTAELLNQAAKTAAFEIQEARSLFAGSGRRR